ncbi:terpenoid synthase [Neolentinus lepideus HHB14362 ss-1]|uniref:Terpenoid synthase n=1 Tax=Neolentinus lepideus HHB14362 ss-1 TaxID=1314782 RepID=A0A165SQT5_9AGAM|nr:terpenoid synthase [Neolentinus lepideus HHB14362 ss-1]
MGAQANIDISRAEVPTSKWSSISKVVDPTHDKLSGEGSVDYITRLRHLLHEIGHRYEPPPPQDEEFDNIFHEWMLTVVRPVLGWNDEKLAALEDQGSRVVIRAYPHADREMKLIISKLTALAIVIDDSLEDEQMYEQITMFSHNLYVGQPQPANTILPLYEECIRELSAIYGVDPVLRGLGVPPWIAFVDASSLEKRISTVDEALRASPWDTGYQRLSECQRQRGDTTNELSSMKLDRQATLTCKLCSSPYFLRQKTAIGEAYAAAIFKAYRTQELPLTRYIKAIPDANFTIEIMNDLLSFHKEELEGEKINLIQLLTQSIRSDRSTTGGSEWDSNDTFNLLCNQVRDAFERVDSLLRLHEFDTDASKEFIAGDDADRAMDYEIARQWRGWRDGYISWHLESSRYKLDFLRPTKFHEQ